MAPADEQDELSSRAREHARRLLERLSQDVKELSAPVGDKLPPEQQERGRALAAELIRVTKRLMRTMEQEESVDDGNGGET